jgi:hypothetical protein
VEKKMKKALINVLFCFVQMTWGIVQSLAGLTVMIICKRKIVRHQFNKGAVLTVWNANANMTLGMFIFMNSDPPHDVRLGYEISKDDNFRRTYVHEYGHTIQSLILGPLYFFIIGISSSIWCNSKKLKDRRMRNMSSYYSFYTEKWANHLGERVLKMESMEDAVIE